MICPLAANTAIVSRAPTSRRRAVFRKIRFLHEAHGKRDGVDVDHRRLPHIFGQERRPIADERAGGERGEDLRLTRPAGQRVIDEDVIEGRLDQRFDGKREGLADLPAGREKEA